ncbi:type I-E CRISPR-associated protein Cse1/CasA [Streptomyces sp. NBC_01754]|uniref:type I-E CRISPR-associated protein Cse1/CasA n=1 Tax=Streptomyces sp. NBC_01754 TaxID=2975930 RepID=UPI002DD93485|nr:type I-E CRISPR-associated protein Cse1/CasA [Streptomyces sp. NBC_01754]WSC91235.1 type I-E CRISPR-associated protein Cse1/CasA [Streptomyces sp. NBC_01754]
MSDPSGCLVDHLDWLPVAGPDGPREVPLRETLLEAHTFTGLVPDMPTMLPVLLRQILVPVVLDALGGVDAEAWARLMDTGAFTTEQRETINRYLDERVDRFNVLDATAPFGQAPGLAHPGGKVHPVTVLMPHVATGNNTPLWDARLVSDPVPLSVGAATRWMLHAQCWDTAAIKTAAVGDPQVKAGKTTGNRTGPLGRLGVVTLLGRTLFDTIVLNLPQGGRTAGDRPQWDRPPVDQTWSTRTPTGPLDLFTWQGRRIRLVPEPSSTVGPTQVRWVVLSAGDRIDGPQPEDPHTCWTIKKDKTKGSVRYPRRHLPGLTGWQGLDSLLTIDRDTAGYETSGLLMQAASATLADDLASDYPLRAATCGMVYGTQDAIVSDVLSDEVPLPVGALRSDLAVRGSVILVCEQAQALARAVDHLAANLLRAVGGEPPARGKGQQPGTKLLHTLDALVRRFLTGCQGNPSDDRLDQAHTAFETLAERAARSAADELLHRLPGTAFTGRTVTKKDRGKPITTTYRQASAERFFNAAVRKTLTHLYPQTPPPEENAA